MSVWRVAREQWVAWIEAGPMPSARRVVGPLDALDAELAQRLARNPFLSGDEETQSRPGLSNVEEFDSMTTMVRPLVDDDDATQVSRIPREVLEVALRSPEAGLEVSLDAAPEVEPEELSPVAGETVVMEAPLPRMPVAHAGGEDSGAWRRPDEPPSDEAGDGLFIPALTRTLIAPMPVPASDEPPPDELPPLTAHTVIAPPPVAGPPPISGQTVIGPPPSPPPPPPEAVEPPLASTSTTSGVIMTASEEAAPMPNRSEAPNEVVPPRKSKVVVDPAASGVHKAVFDDEPEETAVELEPDEPDEPDELDASDLVEESPEPELLPPRAPSRPPPAREPELAARPGRPPIEAGPPPPPLSSASFDAALAAVAPAPPIDEGWQVDAFGDHHAALVSPQRPAAAAAEVDFIVHCASLHPGAAVLDVGCGDGAHCVGLALRGLAVTGLDASPVQLMRASQAAQGNGVNVQLVAGDMRQPPIEGSFDAILCIGSTLGMYSDEDDRSAMKHMRDRLAPGGRLMLHVLNRDYLVARLPARSWWQGQGCLVLDEAQLFSPTSRVHVHRTVVFETGKQFEHNIGLRLYGLTELVQMCAQVGLRVLEYSGSRHTRGRFYGATSSEIWLLAQRVD